MSPPATLKTRASLTGREHLRPLGCQLHGIEPWADLRDLLCLLPAWPKSRVLELAPAFWKQTAEQQDTQKRLAANVFRIATHTQGV
ncbi:hypothetical protein SAMN02745121_09228 [Nannocystis exedens]|uniref:Uncharacterized protein n=1 Tax=Nannocystis exedens TaxID=54 RepID=A0A1I2JA63_9BACT|nr:hypothetical protein [Nannocystis exedens]PCC67887.1 hypothetical protein NAEX_00895 [Nannocystis exedens]SFF50723.1 hypothetical protein SAMN02745121_09228 [Nannocystis exedens]